MTSHPLTRSTTRRGFLIGAGLAAVAAACSGGDGDSDAVSAGAASSTTPQADLPIVAGLASGDVWAGTELRLPFGILRRTDEGPVELLGAPTTIGFRGPDGATIAPRAATFRNAGLEDAGFEHEGIYTISATFPTAGAWEATLDVEGDEGRFAFQVADDPLNPAPGQDAISTASPTPDDTLGVDPICTRSPECALHGVSLDDALAGDRPVVLLFSTPARCQSRWCGPVLEVLLGQVADYEDRVTFVHCEIFRDLQSTDPVPTVAEWNLATEPILYGIDTDGVITARLDGAFDAEEARTFLDAMVA